MDPSWTNFTGCFTSDVAQVLKSYFNDSSRMYLMTSTYEEKKRETSDTIFITKRKKKDYVTVLISKWVRRVGYSDDGFFMVCSGY